MNDITPIQHRSRPVRRPRRYIGRALAAGLVAAAAALPALTATVEPTRAEAPLETPGVTTTSFNRSEGRIGATVINNTEGDRTTFKSDNSYFGVVRGQSRYNSSDPNQSSIKHTSATQVQPWLKASVAESGDYWSYIVRGRPYTATSEYRDGVINASTTSALGYKPNDPGTVTLGEPFLIGAVRHNNFTILTWNGWVHSTFDVRIGDLEESFPFDQQETDNDTETTAVPRAGGPYEETTSVPMAATAELPTRRASAEIRVGGTATVTSARARGVWTSIRNLTIPTIKSRIPTARASRARPPSLTTS